MQNNSTIAGTDVSRFQGHSGTGTVIYSVPGGYPHLQFRQKIALNCFYTNFAVGQFVLYQVPASTVYNKQLRNQIIHQRPSVKGNEVSYFLPHITYLWLFGFSVLGTGELDDCCFTVW